ncbi:MAG: acyl carrier protein [Desulfobacteraceae bacterium]|nr:MAG: acyl carrier protein [Desulfobacteraceae bacterium]
MGLVQGAVAEEEYGLLNETNLEGQENSRVYENMTATSIRDKVRRFMAVELAESGFREEISDEESLLENQILDSLSILKLISFMDEVFGIYFSEEELDPERFETVNRIVELVRNRKGAK